MSYIPASAISTYAGGLTKVTATNTTTTVTGPGIIYNIWTTTTNNELDTFTVIVDGNTIINSHTGGGAKLELSTNPNTTTGFYLKNIALYNNPSIAIGIPFKTSFSIISLRAANTINANYVLFK